MYPTSVGTSPQKEHLTGFLLDFAQIVRAQNLESVANLHTNPPQTIRSKTPQKSVNFFGCKQRSRKYDPKKTHAQIARRQLSRERPSVRFKGFWEMSMSSLENSQTKMWWEVMVFPFYQSPIVFSKQSSTCFEATSPPKTQPPYTKNHLLYTMQRPITVKNNTCNERPLEQ